MRWYDCYIDDKKFVEIKRAIENHEDFDEWGLIEYGDDSRAVEYNLCIDNSTEETEHLSAFYKLIKNENGYWQHDGCDSFYSYNIDFNDNRWKHKLKEAAEKAFESLF